MPFSPTSGVVLSFLLGGDCAAAAREHLTLPPALSAAMEGSFHCVVPQAKMEDSTAPSSRSSPVVTLGMLCATAMTSSAKGICSEPLHRAPGFCDSAASY